MPPGDRTLFMLKVPGYGRFNAKSVEIELLAAEQGKPYNVHDIQNDQLYQLATMDMISPYDAVLISSQDRYRSYVTWMMRNHKGKNLNLLRLVHEILVIYTAPCNGSLSMT